MDIFSCPEGACGAPAEVTDRWTWASTEGPMEHVRTMCLRGHSFTVPLERLRPSLDLDGALAEILHRPASAA
jgi:hypothetical protein